MTHIGPTINLELDNYLQAVPDLGKERP